MIYFHECLNDDETRRDRGGGVRWSPRRGDGWVWSCWDLQVEGGYSGRVGSLVSGKDCVLHSRLRSSRTFTFVIIELFYWSCHVHVKCPLLSDSLVSLRQNGSSSG